MKFARSIRWLGSSAVKSLTALTILLTEPTAARAVDLTAIQAKVQEIISKGKIGCQKDLDQYCYRVASVVGLLSNENTAARSSGASVSRISSVYWANFICPSVRHRFRAKSVCTTNTMSRTKKRGSRRIARSISSSSVTSRA